MGWNRQLDIGVLQFWATPNYDLTFHTVDGRNPANQLRLVVYPSIYKIS